jgi:AAA family ATP:ADP antiporter
MPETEEEEDVRPRLEKFLDIYSHERKIIYPLAAMIFLVCFSFTLLRSAKDIMLLEIGKAELTSYLKSFGTLPLGLAFVAVYTYASTKFSKGAVYYTTSSIFLILYGILMILYPIRISIQPERGSLEEIYPSSLALIATAFENWVIIVLYLVVEMYGTVLFSVLFWGYFDQLISGSRTILLRLIKREDSIH